MIISSLKSLISASLLITGKMKNQYWKNACKSLLSFCPLLVFRELLRSSIHPLCLHLSNPPFLYCLFALYSSIASVTTFLDSFTRAAPFKYTKGSVFVQCSLGQHRWRCNLVKSGFSAHLHRAAEQALVRGVLLKIPRWAAILVTFLGWNSTCISVWPKVKV